MGCLKCGYIAGIQIFIYDYSYDKKMNAEPLYRCPKCGNDNGKLLELMEENNDESFV